ncbi:CopG family ribbon-helix-helix protein [Nostoc sp. FACHB-110]|uniref:CopG family ribbon-helix-helix protein n=1 Tax=Nostoc sp. FACHB-110 TaxID=2692834 RepID=UPI00168A3971|nr:ribbon-helix-helix protein, CopG family [Nostoc sp. FACHB-110]MBD2439913.1 ribbon-helix-helix protein, CopG family [Nostoc sp. FACHB-110]
MSTTSFRLDDDLEEKLEVTAAKLQRTKGWIINDALRQYIAREEQKLRMLEETQEAISDIEAQRVVSGEEVMKWLETWGTSGETQAPKI